ncbi:hypothetical protein FB45DRAFT_935019 [Roridomyces roridus]|uniref:Uncharacterized protein n=1 Tax=Roridomyces roridus TaxID=1738132 RepID=A0AAD7BBI3_9AGAR|nr:hypothetical protein FB45DRAFT_935019 [Roridomyces roridus]
MCKLCGFADHSHDGTPCTKCEVTHEELFTQESLLNEFQRRTGAEHRRLAYMYKNLATVEEKELFFSEHGVRWTEFARLYYFDLVRCTVIDPMHNLLLGVAKNQWFSRWIETGALRARELNIIHEFLETGRLPTRVGESAGGSLTADEYKFATTGPLAVVVPLVWERFQSDADEDYKAALARYPASMTEYRKKLKAWEKTKDSRQKNSRRPPLPKEPFKRSSEPSSGSDTSSDRYCSCMRSTAQLGFIPYN